MRKLLLTAASVSALALAAGLAVAHDEEIEKSAPTGVAMASLASDLAAYGRESQDPVALVEAARILGDVGGEEVERESTAEGGDDTDKDAGTNDSVESLLAEAVAMSEGNDTIAALAAAVEASADTKSLAGGPGWDREVVNARSTRTYYLDFTRGNGEVSISGDHDTDLDLFVYDANGNLVCQDLSYDDNEYCSWWSNRRQTYTIQVQNLGNVWNEYVLRAE
jgi:hypothetical protein